MAFYQRYLPPSAPKEAVHPPPAPESEFFKRYIPAENPKTVTSSNGPIADSVPGEAAEPRKKRKKQSHSVVEAQDIIDGSVAKALSLAHNRKDTVDHEARLTAKHASVRDKYERSTLGADRRRHEESPDAAKDTTDELQPRTVKHGLEPIPQPMDVDLETEDIATPLPEWMTDPLRVAVDARTDMSSLPLSSSTLQTLKKRGYDEAFAIQTAVIPLMAPGKQRYDGDICVSASTGSGKTLSYVLPMIENFRGRPCRELRGLVVVPTRELVNQVRDTFETCAAGSGLQIGIAVGSRTIAEEKAALMERVQVWNPKEYHRRRNMTEKEAIYEMLKTWDEVDSDGDEDLGYEYVWGHVSAVDILICTPGRLVDHMRSTKGFTLQHVEMLAIDEADRLLDQSFQQWVETVVPALEAVPEPPEALKIWYMTRRIRRERRMQKIILSATMTKDIGQLLSLKLKNPKLVLLEGQAGVDEQQVAPQRFELPATLKETAVTLGRMDEKPLILIKLLDELLQKASLSSGNVKPATGTAQHDDTCDDTSSDTDTSPDSSSESDSSDSGSDETSSSGSSSDSEAERPQPKQNSDSKARHQSTHGILIFTNTNEAALRLSHLVSLLRPSWRSLVGTLTKSTESSSGRRLLSAFRKKKLSILVASDRASRGLDIKDLATVVSYDIPTSLMSYVHRVGRTARAGQSGEALTIVAFHEGRWFWNEIGRSIAVVRREKLGRREGVGKEVKEGEREDYVQALARLGEDARKAK